MVTFYCPECWNVVEHDGLVCRHCAADIPRIQNERDDVRRLIAPLCHSEPETPIRAAHILGRLCVHQAVDPLLGFVVSDADIYQEISATEALGRIGDRRAELIRKRSRRQERARRSNFQLLRIEEDLGEKARYAGNEPFRRSIGRG